MKFDQNARWMVRLHLGFIRTGNRHGKGSCKTNRKENRCGNPETILIHFDLLSF